MAVIHRRVFYAKVGQADPLVSHFQEADKAMQKFGVNIKSRILTDHLSGRSDRVALEWELEDLSEMDAAFEGMMFSPEGRAYFSDWLEKLNGFIHYSEADNWHVR